jgi:hypothetical protein
VLPPDDSPAPTFGSVCSERLKLASRAAREKGLPFNWADCAPIIDAAYQALEGPSAAKQSKSSPFGDRKAIPPSPEQVTAYSASIGYPMNGQAWCDAYEAKGWMAGKVKMKDWQAAVRNWKQSGYGQKDSIALKPKAAPTGKRYDSL